MVVSGYFQMMSEQQQIEAPQSPSVESHTPPPPAYEEVNGVFASQPQNGTMDSMSYFLGEVSDWDLLAALHCDWKTKKISLHSHC